jgi:hypothetical protein
MLYNCLCAAEEHHDSFINNIGVNAMQKKPVDAKILETELFRVMKGSQDYQCDEDIIEEIEDMRARVLDGEDPDEVLHEAGLEPDYIFDIIGM